MNDYVEVRIDLDPCSEDMTDVLAAMLADAGFESFVPDAKGMLAYVRSELYDESMAQIPEQLPFDCNATWTPVTIEGRDWNHEWEKNYFQPIVVGDRCVIHSSFHTDIPTCDYDITVDPKMAFGTGHHATTFLMISRLLDMDLRNRSVIDMGTGTGILAILAAMRGASSVTGIEIDRFAYENAIDNCALNSHSDITLICGTADNLAEVPYEADLLLANINRNVITGDIDRYAAKFKEGGVMLLSGFYVEDIPVVQAAAGPCGLEMSDFTERDRWACLRFVKTKNND